MPPQQAALRERLDDWLHESCIRPAGTIPQRTSVPLPLVFANSYTLWPSDDVPAEEVPVRMSAPSSDRADVTLRWHDGAVSMAQLKVSKPRSKSVASTSWRPVSLIDLGWTGSAPKPSPRLVVIEGMPGTGKTSARVSELLRRALVLERQEYEIRLDFEDFLSRLVRIHTDWTTEFAALSLVVPQPNGETCAASASGPRSHSSRLPACSMLRKHRVKVFEAYISDNSGSIERTPAPSAHDRMSLAAFMQVGAYYVIASLFEQSLRRLLQVQRCLKALHLTLRALLSPARRAVPQIGAPLSRALVQFRSALVGTLTRTAPPTAA